MTKNDYKKNLIWSLLKSIKNAVKNSQSLAEGYEADSSYCKCYLPEQKESKYCSWEIKLIDTEDIILPQKTLEANALRNQNIQAFWNDLSKEEMTKNPQKNLKHLTDHYTNYLATKLNCLFVKMSTYPDYGSYLSPIFHSHTMSELLGIYHKILNSDPNRAKIDQEIEEINKLFKLLEQDYNSQYQLPTFYN